MKHDLFPTIHRQSFDNRNPGKIDFLQCVMICCCVSEIKEIEYFVVEELDDQRRLQRRTWHTAIDRQIHREGGPAVQAFDPKRGNLIEEIWIDIFNQGKHRGGDLPAEKSIDAATGVVTHELHYQNGRQHRADGGPAGIFRDSTTGKAICHTYLQEGYRHRNGGLPAIIEFDPDSGQVIREEYFQNDRLHRENGPAVVEYDQTGRVKPGSERYFVNGQPNGKLTFPSP